MLLFSPVIFTVLNITMHNFDKTPEKPSMHLTEMQETSGLPEVLTAYSCEIQPRQVGTAAKMGEISFTKHCVTLISRGLFS